MQLGFGIAFPDLYEREGLIRLDSAFLAFLGETDRALADKLVAARAHPPVGTAESELLIALAPHVEDWLARLFGIEREVAALQAAQNELAPLFACKRSSPSFFASKPKRRRSPRSTTSSRRSTR